MNRTHARGGSPRQTERAVREPPVLGRDIGPGSYGASRRARRHVHDRLSSRSISLPPGETGSEVAGGGKLRPLRRPYALRAFHLTPSAPIVLAKTSPSHALRLISWH